MFMYYMSLFWSFQVWWDGDGDGWPGESKWGEYSKLQRHLGSNAKTSVEWGKKGKREEEQGCLCYLGHCAT